MDKLFWKVLNWNIRGTNDPEKWPLILNKIKESGCHVICLQESKREHVDLPFLRNFCPRNFDSFAFVPSVGRSGVLLQSGIVLFSRGTVCFTIVMLFLLNYNPPNQIYFGP
jgi:exonuclease III